MPEYHIFWFLYFKINLKILLFALCGRYSAVYVFRWIQYVNEWKENVNAEWRNTGRNQNNSRCHAVTLTLAYTSDCYKWNDKIFTNWCSYDYHKNYWLVIYEIKFYENHYYIFHLLSLEEHLSLKIRTKKYPQARQAFIYNWLLPSKVILNIFRTNFTMKDRLVKM